MSRVFELIDRQSGEVTFAGVAVSRRSPCPVCHHDTWCLNDVYRGLTICPRTVSSRQIGEAGYLHGEGQITTLQRAAASVPKPRPIINWAPIVNRHQAAITEAQVIAAAVMLGVSTESLDALGLGWDKLTQAHAFPMRDHRRQIVGVRFRKLDGFKFAVEGSRNGLFYPELLHDGPVFLPEGPTDTAAVWSMGADAIGRPFCRGGIDALCEVFDYLKRPAVIVADQDKPGIEGANATAEALFGIAAWVKVIQPPPGIKDARAWHQAGANHDSLMYAVDQVDLWRPTE